MKKFFIVGLLIVNCIAAKADYQPYGTPDFYVRVAKGEVSGAISYYRFGTNPDIDTGTVPETIWDGAETYSYSTDSDITDVTSSDGADTQHITITGLDSNWELSTETVQLNGQNKVPITTLIRVFEVVNANAVSFNGDIYIMTSGAPITAGVPDNSSDIRAKIINGNNKTEMALFTVPVCYNAYVTRVCTAFSDTKSSATAIVQVKTRKEGSVFLVNNSIPLQASSGKTEYKYDFPMKLDPKTDFEISVKDITVSDSSISGGVCYWLQAIPGCTP